VKDWKYTNIYNRETLYIVTIFLNT
jgi:hypothetical protein